MSRFNHKPAWLKAITDTGPIVWGIVFCAIWALVIVGFALHEATLRERDKAYEEALDVNNKTVLSDEVRIRTLLAGLDKVILVVRKDFADNPKMTHQQLMDRLAVLQLDSNIDPHIFVFDASGNMMLMSSRSDDAHSLKLNFADREYFQKQKTDASDVLRVDAPVLSRVTGQRSVPLTRHITNTDGTFGGIVGMSVNPSLFTEPFEQSSPGLQDSRSIIGFDGYTRMRLTRGKIEFTSDVRKSQVFNEIKKAKSGSYTAIAAIDGVKRLVSYRVIDPYEIIVVAATPVSAIEGAYANEVRRFTLVAAVCSVLILLLSGLLIYGVGRQRRYVETQQSFNELIEMVPQSVFRMNAAGKIVWANRRTVDYAGPSEEEQAKGFDWVVEAVHPEDRGRLKDFVIDAMKQQITKESFEYRKRRFDGAYLWYSLQVTLLRGANGVDDYYLTTATDIHDRKMAEERARVAQKLESIGQLTGGMAHDFNNLLAIIVGNLDLVKSNVKVEADSKRLDVAIGAAQRGVGLVKSLLALASKQPLLPVTVNLWVLIERISPLLSHALGQRVNFALKPPGDNVHVEVDEAGLEAVLLNLIVNAKDAMPKGGDLTLGLEVTDGMARIVVQDTGTGMSAAVLKRATEPFFTTKERGRGTGLGLSMVAGFAKQSGGTMKIQSAEGLGTTIEIALPLAQAANPVSTQSKSVIMPNQKAVSTNKLKILIVDDEPALAALVRDWAKAQGHTAVVAHSADDALTLLAVRAFDVLLSDIIMPGQLDGISLAEKAGVMHPAMKILLMSGYSRETATNRADVPWPLLVKPFSKEVLETALGQN